MSYRNKKVNRRHILRVCVIFNKAPVAFLCTLWSFDFAKSTKSLSASDLAIFVLFSSTKALLDLLCIIHKLYIYIYVLPWVARFVIQPTALH